MKKYILAFVFSLFLFIGKGYCVTNAIVDIEKMSINDLMDAMDKGYLDSETLVNIYLERIDKYDSVFNSINQINPDALEYARELDKEREEGKIRGKLHGIPILVKANIDVVGIPTTGGTESLSDNFPKENSLAVQKLIDEGAIILGSTNMSELAFSAATSYSKFGYVKNVFNPDYTAYGSSGGAAVAVKAGFAVAALGTDTNASVRAPSSGAGVVGLRPTFGLISRNGVIPYDIERDTIGVITRCVSDNTLITSIIASSDIDNDKVYGEIIDSSLVGVRIGVPTQYLKGKKSDNGVTSLTDEDVYELASLSIKKLEAQGAEIIYLDAFVKNSNLRIASNTMAGSTFCNGFNDYIKGTNSKIKNFKELSKSSGHTYDLSGYLPLCGEDKYKSYRDKEKSKYREYVIDYYNEYNLDVIAYPTIKNKVFGYKERGAKIPGSSLGSVIGFPSITVPMGYIEEFAYGLEFMGLSYSENKLFGIARGFELVSDIEMSYSKLTPSLYNVPAEVNELIIAYEEVLNIVVKSKKDLIWLSDVENFIDNYSQDDECLNNAKVLLERYDNLNVIKFNISNNLKNIIRVTVNIIVFLVLLILVTEFKRCIK